MFPIWGGVANPPRLAAGRMAGAWVVELESIWGSMFGKLLFETEILGTCQTVPLEEKLFLFFVFFFLFFLWLVWEEARVGE